MILEVILLVAVYFFMFFLAGTLIKNNSIVDFGWGMGFVCISLYTLVRTGAFTLINILAVVLVLLWGVRLFYHILKRNIGKPEDFRYANWRKEWGKWVVLRSFFQVYMLQGLFMLVIAFPLVLLIASEEAVNVFLAATGTLVWIVGYYFEVVGDAQLKAFKANPDNKGKLMTQGLWAYTRHPNYFGEAVMWWGIAIIALSKGTSPIVLLSPVVITFLLRFVSGVPMLEKAMKDRPGYDAYCQRTNVFIPMRKRG